MSKQREALEKGLEWIRDALVVLSNASLAIQGGIGAEAEGVGQCSVKVVDAIREALAEPEQEAAPDLLEALELMVDTYDNGGWPSSTLVIARAAIAKAKEDV